MQLGTALADQPDLLRVLARRSVRWAEFGGGRGKLAAADAAGVHGRDVTPFLLAHIGQTARGASLAASVALVKHNAAVAAEIAAALAALPTLGVERN